MSLGRNHGFLSLVTLILSVRSDEEGCSLVVLDRGYNKIVPPFSIKGKLGSGGNIQPVPVNVSIKLLNILDVDEVDFSISFQFRITLQWLEYRASYNNLKKNRYMNSFAQEDINKLWLPLLIYDNTDQKETTRLGENWEWSTNVFITREGKSVESSDEEVDERRIYKGAENRLTMQQTYAHKFRCIYELQPYPFDTQVKQKFVTGRDTCFSLFFSFRNVRSTLC